MNKKKYVIDEYEQFIEDNLEKGKAVSDEKKLKGLVVAAAQKHMQAKKSITIRVSCQDIEVIKIKASKLGVPYQTYINMLIHKDTQGL